METNTERDGGQLSSDQRDERIRVIAYSIWEDEGCPDGCADDHWHRARAIFEAQLAVEQMRDPDWLKRDTGAAEGIPVPQTTGEPAGILVARQIRRTAA